MSLPTIDRWGSLQRRLEAEARKSLYRKDPAAWASDKLGASLWSKQREIVGSVVAHRRTLVKSCHGVGKSWTAGAIAAWWIDTHPIGEALGGLAGRVLPNDEWTIGRSLVAMGRKPADHDANGFQGIHRRYVLAILDEACGIPAQLWTAVEAVTTNTDCRILAIGNPDDPNTQFGKNAQPGAGWNTIRIAMADSPNFTGELVADELRHLMPSPEWAEDAARRWGKDSPVYRSKVEGEFPDQSEDTLIPSGWIARAQERDINPPPGAARWVGVDVARYGTDKTVLVEWIHGAAGGRARVVRSQNYGATTETTGLVLADLLAHPGSEAHVDGVGVGGGVVDQLADLEAPVSDMQAGGAAANPAKFVNARAEWFWELRGLFERGEIDLDPHDDDLAAQLGQLRFRYDGRARIGIESEDDKKAWGVPSPNRADALMLAIGKPRPATRQGTTTFDIG